MVKPPHPHFEKEWPLGGFLYPPKGFLGRARGAGWVASRLARRGWGRHRLSWDNEWEVWSDYAEIVVHSQAGETWLTGVIRDYATSLDRFQEELRHWRIEHRLELEEGFSVRTADPTG